MGGGTATINLKLKVSGKNRGGDRTARGTAMKITVIKRIKKKEKQNILFNEDVNINNFNKLYD